MPRRRWVLALALSAVVAAAGAATGRAAPPPASAPAPASPGPLQELQLPNGQTADVLENGLVRIFSRDRRQVEYRTFPALAGADAGGASPFGLMTRAQLMTELLKGAPQPYTPSTVVVVFRQGVSATSDVGLVTPSTLTAMRLARAAGRSAAPPTYTNDAATNVTLGGLGVDRIERLFRAFDQPSLAVMHGSLQRSLASPVVDFSNAYRLHLTGASVTGAIARLAREPNVAYVSPDWRVDTAQSAAVPLTNQAVAAPRAGARPAISSALPSNYAVAATAQSMLDTPSVNAVSAYDEVSRYLHQLPGQGEIVTNVSLGDLDDASATTRPNDPCAFFASVFGPTTQLIGGQRFLDMPSMPQIPTYTSDSSGRLDGAGEVCGVDPTLGEVGLDFSTMAPLPHDLQRPGGQGAGLTDLLGIAPGAGYRLVVPSSSAPSVSDIDAALLGAALQNPRPNVITASLGFGLDAQGFPGRFLEDDPLTQAVISALVHSFGIAVCISANDGTRLFTNAAVSPSGGSAATDVIPAGGQPTSISDIGHSTVASRDFDSGSIDAGGTTLDDIFAAPPQYAGGGPAAAQQAYAETRWTGFTNFSSGYGSRVDVSAPSDNVLALSHTFGGGPDAVDVGLNGGTSASAPEVAAAAAVLLQAARLTGQPFADPVALRSFLQATGDPVARVPQADTPLPIGPQVDLGRAVETLLARARVAVQPGAARVAVAQRRSAGLFDGAFTTDTDPASIDLQGPLSGGAPTDRDQLAWITLAPDWEGVSGSARFRLTVTGHPDRVLATTRWARLLPGQILAAAGLPMASTSNRTVSLTYSAGGVHVDIPLTFGPAGATTARALAPRVPAVVRGGQLSVTYDLSNVRGLETPTLVVSEPGRVDPSTGLFFRPAFSTALKAPKGTVQVPVSALPGGGIYGVGIQLNKTVFSDFAFTRVAPAADARAAAPLLAANGSTPGHELEIPYGGSFQVSWDVSRVPGATGAALEIASPGPNAANSLNTFNNPGGTGRDANGADRGSPFFMPLTGTSGTVTLKASQAGLVPTMNQVVRVLPMRFGAQVGEDGDVSSITMDGVQASDGGFVNNGYGVSTGFDGFLTSGQQTASGQVLTSLETFDQNTNAVASTVASASDALYFTTGGEIWGGDVSIAGLQTLGSAGTTSYNLLSPVSGGSVGAAWSPPQAATLSIVEGAADQVDDSAAFLAFDSSTAGSSHWRVVTSDLAANTFGPVLDLSPALTGVAQPDAFGFAEDTTTKTGVTAIGDLSQFCGPAPPTIVTTDLATGTSRSFEGVGAGIPYGIAVDSASHKAAVPTLCDHGLGIYDLATGRATQVTLRGGNGLYAAADPRHGRFLVEQTATAGFGVDNNAMSAVLVLDEQGNQLASVEQFNLFNTFLTIGANNLQLNPGRRTGYLFGPLQGSLEPFSY